eukprot:767125-Hanusia_phi.AAC.6
MAGLQTEMEFEPNDTLAELKVETMYSFLLAHLSPPDQDRGPDVVAGWSCEQGRIPGFSYASRL